jgi:hypothetical protein
MIDLGAWAVLASASHADWIAGLRLNGFRTGPWRRHWLVSRPLAEALEPFAMRASRCFLTFGDGENYHGSLGREFFSVEGES